MRSEPAPVRAGSALRYVDGWINAGPSGDAARETARPRPRRRGGSGTCPMHSRLKSLRHSTVPFQPKPGKPDQLLALVEPARSQGSGRFPHTKGFTFHGNALKKFTGTVSCPPKSRNRHNDFRLFAPPESVGAHRWGIAVTRRRFYDLTVLMATLIWMPANSPRDTAATERLA